MKLDRVQFAGLTKKNLRRGDWRFLTEKEVEMLRMGAFAYIVRLKKNNINSWCVGRFGPCRCLRFMHCEHDEDRGTCRKG